MGGIYEFQPKALLINTAFPTIATGQGGRLLKRASSGWKQLKNALFHTAILTEYIEPATFVKNIFP
jgi:hypothetical protein